MASSNEEERSVDSFLKTLRVLYVEDNDEVREQLTLFLQRRFDTILTAEDGAAGLKQFEASSPYPDLVITDVRMPIMDGLSMTGHIREKYGDVPVIVTTAHEETDYLIHAINLGVDQFVVKPVDTRQFRRALHKIGSRLQSEHALLDARRTLQENEARYRAIFWTAMDAFCVFEWDSFNITEINRRFQSVYGFAPHQVVGQNLAMLFDQSQGVMLHDLVAETTELKEPMIARHVNKDGDVFPVEMAIGHFRVSGAPYGLLAIRDARERIENMEEQEAVVDALEMTIDALEGMLDR